MDIKPSSAARCAGVAASAKVAWPSKRAPRGPAVPWPVTASSPLSVLSVSVAPALPWPCTRSRYVPTGAIDVSAVPALRQRTSAIWPAGKLPPRLKACHLISSIPSGASVFQGAPSAGSTVAGTRSDCAGTDMPFQPRRARKGPCSQGCVTSSAIASQRHCHCTGCGNTRREPCGPKATQALPCHTVPPASASDTREESDCMASNQRAGSTLAPAATAQAQLASQSAAARLFKRTHAISGLPTVRAASA